MMRRLDAGACITRLLLDVAGIALSGAMNGPLVPPAPLGWESKYYVVQHGPVFPLDSATSAPIFPMSFKLFCACATCFEAHWEKTQPCSCGLFQPYY